MSEEIIQAKSFTPEAVDKFINYGDWIIFPKFVGELDMSKVSLPLSDLADGLGGYHFY